jgi:hypothetical protein
LIGNPRIQLHFRLRGCRRPGRLEFSLRQKNIIFSSLRFSGGVRSPTVPPAGVLEAVSLEVKWPVSEPEIRLYRVPRFRIHGAMPTFHHALSGRGA